MGEKTGDMSDAFLSTLRIQSEVFVITIPKRTVEFMGWSEGDELRSIAQKVLKKEE